MASDGADDTSQLFTPVSMIPFTLVFFGGFSLFGFCFFPQFFYEFTVYHGIECVQTQRQVRFFIVWETGLCSKSSHRVCPDDLPLVKSCCTFPI